jgi:hypothetical protein
VRVAIGEKFFLVWIWHRETNAGIAADIIAILVENTSSLAIKATGLSQFPNRPARESAKLPVRSADLQLEFD